VEGGGYTPSPSVQYAVRAIRVAQAGAVAFYFFGEAMFSSVGRAPPRLLRQMDENKLVSGGFVYGLHVVASTLKSINAFEVTYNGRVLHSKLTSGQFPSPAELIQGLASAKKDEKQQAAALAAAAGGKAS